MSGSLPVLWPWWPCSLQRIRRSRRSGRSTLQGTSPCSSHRPHSSGSRGDMESEHRSFRNSPGEMKKELALRKNWDNCLDNCWIPLLAHEDVPCNYKPNLQYLGKRIMNAISKPRSSLLVPVNLLIGCFATHPAVVSQCQLQHELLGAPSQRPCAFSDKANELWMHKGTMAAENFILGEPVFGPKAMDTQPVKFWQ